MDVTIDRDVLPQTLANQTTSVTKSDCGSKSCSTQLNFFASFKTVAVNLLLWQFFQDQRIFLQVHALALISLNAYIWRISL